MLTLYNASTSVCSVKVRIGLAEKKLEWNNVLLSLPKGEQFASEYLNINPNGVVPTLVHDELIVTESSVILEYIDELSNENRLMPTDRAAKVVTKIWLLRCLDIHSAINTMTFSTANRDAILASKTATEIADSIAKMPNPRMAAKRSDILDKGLASSYVQGDFFTLRQTFDDMQKALDNHQWLTGNSFAMSDVALIAYIDRLDRLGLSGLWQKRAPGITKWLHSVQARPSYNEAFEGYVTAQEASKTLNAGASHWKAVEQRWGEFLG